ncbi:MAG: helix-turn-helix domain-containing protein [Gaiellaceae bacterium]
MDHSADYEAEDVLVVSEPEQLRALADDLRTKIVSILRKSASSTQELARELGLPKGTVAHHLKVLERAGLIRVVRTRKVRAMTEKYYGRVARLFVYKVEDPADARALGSAALRQAADELDAAPEGAAFGLIAGRLTTADVKRFERRLDRLVDDFQRCEAAEGTPFRLALALWRDERRDA